jgi:hypothetical protein
VPLVEDDKLIALKTTIPSGKGSYTWLRSLPSHH